MSKQPSPTARSTEAAAPAPHSHSAGSETSQREDQAEQRRQRTALAAYYRAEARNFAPGRELEDWLAAERELDELDEAEADGGSGSDPNASAAGEDGAVQPSTEISADARDNVKARVKPAAKRAKSGRAAVETLGARGRG